MGHAAPGRVSRRGVLKGAAAAVAALPLAGLATRPAGARSPRRSAASHSSRASGEPTPAGAAALFAELDAKIQTAMAALQIPGVAVGVYYQGDEHVRGYGVTNLDYPLPVDGDTLFRIGSTTKTFTGTSIMRLVEQGRLALDAPVRTYLPDLQLMDADAAARVTVRQLLNHSAGWLGDYFGDFGRGADALGRYVAGMAALPQLTPLGQVFAYNNAAVTLAGYLIETVTGQAYEAVVQALVLDPLALDHSFFESDAIIGYNVTASHTTVEGQSVVTPTAWHLPRSLHPTGGLISSARDQLRYARYHMSDGASVAGSPVLSAASLRAMRSPVGPGGTLVAEIDGIGVNWWQQVTAEGVPVYQHGGSWAGQNSGFLFVPDRDFAFTMLTNADSSIPLRTDLFFGDWAISRFAGLHNPPSVPLTLSAAELAPYEGVYVARAIDPPPGNPTEISISLSATGGRLQGRIPGDDSTKELDLEPAEVPVTLDLAFYGENHVVVLDGDGQPTPTRSDFVPDANDGIAWFRFGGRLYRHLG